MEEIGWIKFCPTVLNMGDISGEFSTVGFIHDMNTFKYIDIINRIEKGEDVTVDYFKSTVGGILVPKKLKNQLFEVLNKYNKTDLIAIFLEKTKDDIHQKKEFEL